MKLKTLIILGLIILSCSCTHSQQAQYWKETPYGLENVDFNTDVAKFFSKAREITDTMRYTTTVNNPLFYILEKHTLGDTVIYDYRVNGLNPVRRWRNTVKSYFRTTGNTPDNRP